MYETHTRLDFPFSPNLAQYVILHCFLSFRFKGLKRKPQLDHLPGDGALSEDISLMPNKNHRGLGALLDHLVGNTLKSERPFPFSEQCTE